MKNRIYPVVISALLLMASTPLLAHTTGLHGLMHIFTGEHLVMLILAGVFAVGATRLYRRFR